MVSSLRRRCALSAAALLATAAVVYLCAEGVERSRAAPAEALARQPGRSLEFAAPRLVEETFNASGPWFCDVHGLSSTHALGRAGGRMLATTDGGHSWQTLPGWENKTHPAIYHDAAGTSFHNFGAVKLLPGPHNVNVTGISTSATTTFFLGPEGDFQNKPDRPVSISGLPQLRAVRAGVAGAWLRLPDGSMVGTMVTAGVGKTRTGLLSVVALHSRDGFDWEYTGVIAAAEEVRYAHEGPSENALAFLTNGSIICVMRVEGESGHHSPYISKVSDDGGKSWQHLRSLKKWPGAETAPGCVRPRLLSLQGSLVLAGGRPSPVSKDPLLWLNAAGDGEDWEPYSVSYWHNRLVANASWAFPQGPTNNSRRLPRVTTAYMSLVGTGPASGFLLYGMGIRSFAIPFRLGETTAVV